MGNISEERQKAPYSKKNQPEFTGTIQGMIMTTSPGPLHLALHLDITIKKKLIERS